MVVPDLGYGGCRLVVAVPESWIDVTHIIDLVDLTAEFKAAGKTFRVSTKYPALTQALLPQVGHLLLPVDRLRRRPRAAPEPGDRRHHRRPDELGDDPEGQPPHGDRGGTVLESASCLIGHAPSLAALVDEGETGPLALLLDAMDGVRASEGMLHLEVVGSPAAPGPETAAAVADYLRDQGAQHIARGEVWDDRGEPGWRVTALVAAKQAHRLPAPAVPARRQPGRRPARPVRLRPRRPLHLRRPLPPA